MSRGLELLIAQTILQGFDAQYGRFLEVTAGAQQRFELADWHAVQQAMKQRIHLYDHHVGLVVEQLRCITDSQRPDAEFLLRVKAHYTHLLPDYPRFEIAESFLTPSTVACSITARLAPSVCLFLALSQNGAFAPFRARWQRLLARAWLGIPVNQGLIRFAASPALAG
jgi:isocitrate dehydrogenase kinase/phosphatase